MVGKKSLLELVKSLETQIVSPLKAIDTYSLPAKEAGLISKLRREVIDAKLDIKDYEFSETAKERLKYAAAAKKRLGNVRKHILAVSEYNIFSAVDVALSTAQLEQIIESIV